MDAERLTTNAGEGGPVAMARTAQGTIYLYAVGADDLQAYLGLSGFSAGERVRWLLTRVASRGASGPLTDDEVAAMAEGDVEALAEQFLGTPQVQQRALALGPHNAMKRAPSESAIAFLDRLLRRPEPAPVAATAAAAGTGKETGRFLSWGIAALVMGCVLSGLAALFTYRSYEREVALETQVQRLRLQLEAGNAQRDAQLKSSLQAMASQNQELRARIDRLEARPMRSPDRPPDRGTQASKAGKSRARTHR